jgi:hypothetical protein
LYFSLVYKFRAAQFVEKYPDTRLPYRTALIAELPETVWAAHMLRAEEFQQDISAGLERKKGKLVEYC